MARHPVLVEIFEPRHPTKMVAEALGISTAAVSQWELIPADRAADVSRILGIPIDRLPVATERAKPGPKPRPRDAGA